MLNKQLKKLFACFLGTICLFAALQEVKGEDQWYSDVGSLNVKLEEGRTGEHKLPGSAGS